MKPIHKKWLMAGLAGTAFVLLMAIQAMAIPIDNYDPKWNGTRGTITEIDGNKITIQNDSGKEIKIKVKDPGLSEAYHFKVSDRVRIINGQLKKQSRFRHPVITPPPADNKPADTSSPEQEE